MENEHENKEQELYLENLKDSEWLGEIISNEDPLNQGRCKIRIYEKFDNIEDDDLPWAYPINSNVFAGGESKGYGSFSYPKIGSLVRVKFNHGDYYHPEYRTIENINKKLQSEIKEDSYLNAQVITFDEDEDLKIIYTQPQGLMIWHKGSFVQIDKEKHITIQHVENPSIITLIDGTITIKAKDHIIEESPHIYLDATDKCEVGHSPAEHAVKCESLKQFLTALCAIVDAKVPSAPAATNLLNGPLGQKLCSKIVWIAD